MPRDRNKTYADLQSEAARDKKKPKPPKKKVQARKGGKASKSVTL